MSGKPVIFFSHSSRDKQELLLLKELFLEKTGGTVDVFLSSDGQSIPLGRNWVHRIEEALGEAKLLVTFITENSIGSSWVSFEAGFAYSKGVRVVPVGFLGLDIAKIPPPLGLLQGFNISSPDGLDNLIALVNEALHHQHRARFTTEEYIRIVGNASLGEVDQSLFSTRIDEIRITLPKPTQAVGTPSGRAEAAANLLSPEAIVVSHQHSATAVFHGGYLKVLTKDEPEMTVDPSVFDLYSEKIAKLYAMLGCCEGQVKTIVTFVEGVRAHHEQHKVSARLIDCGIKLEGSEFRFGPFIFAIYQHQNLFLRATHVGSDYPISDLDELIDLLFEREVLTYERDIPW